MPSPLGEHPEMDESTANTLSANLTALMENDRELTTDAKVAKAAGVDQKTVWRMVAKSNSATLDKIAKVAAAFDLQTWQLLVPGLEPTNPPVVITRVEYDFFARLTKKEAALITPPPKKR